MQNQRFRSRGSMTFVPSTWPWSSYDLNGPCSGSLVWSNRTPGNTGDWVGTVERMTDTVTPGFRKMQKEGKVVMNYMSKSVQTINPAVVSGELWETGSYLQCPGPNQYYSQYKASPRIILDSLNFGMTPINGFVSPPSPLLSDTQIERALVEASTRCLNNQGRGPQNTWELLAEGRKTALLFKEYLKIASLAVSSLQKASLVKGGRALSDGYLMTRYGLLPAVKDIRGLIAGMAAPTGNIRQTVRGFSLVETYKVTPMTGLLLSYANIDGTIMVSDKLRVRAMSLDEWEVTLSENLGLSLKGLVTLPWELISLSFVADWFLNIGDLIGACVPSPHVTTLGSCISYERVRAVTNTIVGQKPTSGAAIHTSASGQKVFTHVETVRYPGLRNPGLIIRNNFGLSPSLERDYIRIADAAALIGQRLLGIIAKR